MSVLTEELLLSFRKSANTWDYKSLDVLGISKADVQDPKWYLEYVGKFCFEDVFKVLQIRVGIIKLYSKKPRSKSFKVSKRRTPRFKVAKAFRNLGGR